MLQHFSRSIWVLLVIGGVTVAGTGYWWNHRTTTVAETIYRTALVERKDIVVTISASGTVEPEEIVDVGAQVAGKITEFGTEPKTAKPVDYGSAVEAGSVLARIDDSLYTAEVQLARSAFHQAEHQLRSAQSGVTHAKVNVQRAEADLLQLQAVRKQTRQHWERSQQLNGKSGVISAQELEVSEAAFESAEAGYSVGVAALKQAQSLVEAAEIAVGDAQARIEGAQAVLQKAEKNLEYTTIRSPIRGVIVDRRVNIGQTVVSNLNAPSLFLIAKDLRRLEVWASVNEADIGVIRVGLPVQFSVDAFPNEQFQGTVKQVRLNATMAQSVVTYTVVASVDNTSGKLLPYLTANLRFIIDQRKSPLTVPSAALRWQPSSAAGDKRETFDSTTPNDQATVYALEGSTVRRVDFTPGLSDGNDVEVKAGDLREGMQVIVGEVVGPRTQLKNPFAPSLTQGVER